MGLEDTRRRLPIVDALPRPKNRTIPPLAPGEAPKPRAAVWEFTLACDHACLHCGPRAGRPRRDELNTEESLQLVRDLARMGVGEVTLTGGEAYLRNDFLLVLREIRMQGMLASIVTGGYNLTRERVEAAVEAGLLVAGISIDGLEHSHNHVRNTPDSWRRAFAALRLLRDAGCQVNVNTQINVFTRHELPELLELLAAEGVRSWQLQLTAPHGNGADHHDLLLQPYMLLELYEVLDPLISRAAALGMSIWPGNSIGYFGPLERRLRAPVMKKTGHYKGCQAGASGLGIESNGAIKGCPSLGGTMNIGGNIRDHSLEHLWHNTGQLSDLRQRTRADLWGYCHDCYYAEVCLAGCTAVSEPLLGRPGNNPFCHHRALEMDREGLRERIEFVRPAPDVPFGAALFRVVREHKDPERRAVEGPVAIDEPRISRELERTGPGRPLDQDP